jgi:hypothetical protein
MCLARANRRRGIAHSSFRSCIFLSARFLIQRTMVDATRSGPCSLTAVEELIHNLVRTTPGDGYAPLLPHTTAALYFKAGRYPRLVSMFNNSVVMGSTSTMASEEMWRRYIGQQLMLLTELMVFCVPNYFDDHSALPLLGKRKVRGAGRRDMDRRSQFKQVTQADTASVRSMALQYARLAQVRDVMYDDESDELFITVSGLAVPEPHNEKTFFMLLNTDMTPTGTHYSEHYISCTIYYAITSILTTVCFPKQVP